MKKPTTKRVGLFNYLSLENLVRRVCYLTYFKLSEGSPIRPEPDLNAPVLK